MDHLQGVRVRGELFRLVTSNDELVLVLREPANVTPAPREVWARGLHEVLLELESDPELGT